MQEKKLGLIFCVNVKKGKDLVRIDTRKRVSMGAPRTCHFPR